MKKLTLTLTVLLIAATAQAENINKVVLPGVMLYGTLATGGVQSILATSDGCISIATVTVKQSTAANLKATVDITSPSSSDGRIKVDPYADCSVVNKDIVGATTTATVISGVTGQIVRVKSICLWNYSTSDATVTIDWTDGTVFNKNYLSAKQSMGWDAPYTGATNNGVRITTSAGNVYVTIIYTQQ